MTIFFEKINGKIKNFSNQKLPDGRYKITEVKNFRSLEQNKLYWAILNFISENYKEKGFIYTTDFLHEKFKKAFLPRKRIYSDFSKKYVLCLSSTTELNTKQFKNYIENIKIICEFGKLGQIKGLEDIEGFVIDEKDEKFLAWADENFNIYN
ncbi:hypothetical protein DLH72_01015 [Candidatus Gracilibacteria bacterium]|nr:MAG: hypothetical protein DLH72_01015 [Candidatus Gracilibacteria bacterium]